MDPEGDHDHDGETDDQREGLKKNPHKHDSGAADLERVTDYVEEEELGSNLHSVISSLIGQQARAAEGAGKTIIRKEDVELIVREMEVSTKVAEKKLRQHSGNVKDAIRSMLVMK